MGLGLSIGENMEMVWRVFSHYLFSLGHYGVRRIDCSENNIFYERKDTYITFSRNLFSAIHRIGRLRKAKTLFQTLVLLL